MAIKYTFLILREELLTDMYYLCRLECEKRYLYCLYETTAEKIFWI